MLPLSDRFDPKLLARVEEAGLNASAPPQQRIIDGWLVRFSPGKAKRARCANAVSAGRLTLEHKLALCQQLFDEESLPMLVRITPFSEPQGLDEHLAAIGMGEVDDTRVMVNTTPAPQKPPALPSGVTLSDLGHEAFAQTVGVLRGSPLAQRQAHSQRLLNAPVPFSAQVLRRDAEILACGQYAIESGLVGLYDVFTAPAFRGQGWARLLCSLMLAKAAARGAHTAYLQVEGDNHAARAVYARLGFSDAYGYHYRTPDPTRV